VLDDLQFALWPLEAVRGALPADWRVEDDGHERRLLRDGTAWLVLTRDAPDNLRLRNLAEGYALDIRTVGGETNP